MQINLDNLKREAEQNPLMTLMAAGAAITAIAKLLDSASAVSSRRAYARNMNRNARRPRR